MAHYAFLDDKNIVTNVIVGRDEGEIVAGVTNWESYYSNLHGQRCIKTSYSGKIRKNYAGIGYKYDEALDAFIPPKPFESWVLHEETCQWEAPVAYPTDGKSYSWNEDSLNWILIEGE